MKFQAAAFHWLAMLLLLTAHFSTSSAGQSMQPHQGESNQQGRYPPLSLMPHRRLQQVAAGEDTVVSGSLEPVNNTGVFPYSCIGLLRAWTDDWSGSELCTAALVGNDTVLTAAHCVWNLTSNSPYNATHFDFTPSQAYIPQPPPGTVHTTASGQMRHCKHSSLYELLENMSHILLAVVSGSKSSQGYTIVLLKIVLYKLQF